MNTEKLFRRWQNRRLTLLAGLPTLLTKCRGTSEPEPIHLVRVNLRRLWLLTRVGRNLFPNQKSLRRFQQWWQHLADLTSPLRDLDVALEWLAAQPGSAGVRQELHEQRQHRWQTIHKKLTPPPRRILRDLCAVKGGKKQAARLGKRYLQQTTKIQETIRGGMRHFFALPVAEQHDFRRWLRRWRYLQELQVSRRDLDHDRLLKILIRIQTLIGQHRNLGLADSFLVTCSHKFAVARLRVKIATQQAALDANIAKAFRALSKNQRWKLTR